MTLKIDKKTLVAILLMGTIPDAYGMANRFSRTELTPKNEEFRARYVCDLLRTYKICRYKISENNESIYNGQKF